MQFWLGGSRLKQNGVVACESIIVRVGGVTIFGNLGVGCDTTGWIGGNGKNVDGNIGIEVLVETGDKDGEVLLNAGGILVDLVFGFVKIIGGGVNVIGKTTGGGWINL